MWGYLISVCRPQVPDCVRLSRKALVLATAAAWLPVVAATLGGPLLWSYLRKYLPRSLLAHSLLSSHWPAALGWQLATAFLALYAAQERAHPSCAQGLDEKGPLVDRTGRHAD